jgi:hypothetical protein
MTRLALAAMVGLVSLLLIDSASSTTPVKHAEARAGARSARKCVCSYFNIPLATTSVRAYNASGYSDSRLSVLVQYADRGMDTTNPVEDDVSGEMHHGDLVVITEYGIYWIDATTRGGLLSGVWPLSGFKSDVHFQNVVGPDSWSPNLLLPGSSGSDAAEGEGYDGMGIRVIPEGGSDGSSVTGKGTFDPHGTAMVSNMRRDGDDRLFRFSGVLTQEYNGTDILTDSTGNTTQIAYGITYRFTDANDPHATRTLGLPARRVSDANIINVGVSLTPESTQGSCLFHNAHCFQLSVFGIGDDLQFLSTTEGQPDLSMLSTEDTLGDYVPAGCPDGGDYPRRTFVTLCTSTPVDEQNFIQEPTVLPTTVPVGDESVFCSTNCARRVVYLHPEGFTPPARDAAVYSRILNVIAVESQYFNINDPVQTWYEGKTVRTDEDQLIQ